MPTLDEIKEIEAIEKYLVELEGVLQFTKACLTKWELKKRRTRAKNGEKATKIETDTITPNDWIRAAMGTISEITGKIQRLRDKRADLERTNESKMVDHIWQERRQTPHLPISRLSLSDD
jgi:hypothetical protein